MIEQKRWLKNTYEGKKLKKVRTALFSGRRDDYDDGDDDKDGERMNEAKIKRRYHG